MAALRRLLSKRQTPPSFACGNVLHSLGAAVVSCCGALSLRGGGWLYAYCNRHGLIRRRV